MSALSRRYRRNNGAGKILIRTTERNGINITITVGFANHKVICGTSNMKMWVYIPCIPCFAKVEKQHLRILQWRILLKIRNATNDSSKQCICMHDDHKLPGRNDRECVWHFERYFDAIYFTAEHGYVAEDSPGNCRSRYFSSTHAEPLLAPVSTSSFV